MLDLYGKDLVIMVYDYDVMTAKIFFCLRYDICFCIHSLLVEEVKGIFMFTAKYVFDLAVIFIQTISYILWSFENKRYL